MNADATTPTGSRRSRAWVPFALIVPLLFALVVLGLVSGLGAIDHAPIHVTIDGEPWIAGLDLAALPPAHKVLVACLLAVALLAALVIVPVALLVAVTAIVLVLVAAIGLPLVAVVSLLALVLSPLLLIGWLLWRALHPASPTMRA